MQKLNRYRLSFWFAVELRTPQLGCDSGFFLTCEVKGIGVVNAGEHKD